MADNYIEKQFESYQARKAAWEKESKYKRKKAVHQTSGNPANHPCEQLFHNHGKKIVAVHDLSCVGRFSLMAVIPILNSMGFQGFPVPTAILSHHTPNPVFFFFGFSRVM